MLVVSDTGAGMDAEFVRERLFRPFDSTKGSKGMGIGAYQVREYVQMLGGQRGSAEQSRTGHALSRLACPLANRRSAEPASRRRRQPGLSERLTGITAVTRRQSRNC